ncbi:hypothetical protein [Falsirhodobacter algicola]|uniref:Uncharacterized protein n=1 Tax=Falsirhodobacter algicola TaxID=2692330 RepID=A0A8J8MTR3_9RHOB|nr:hypothetical protein [Falsirhodobacter algicola]QUS36292.1 hypothetical protein GR316_08425 [Falsirhodobacter algicola]
MAEKRFSAFVRENWLLLSVFLAAILVALFLASRVFMDFLYFHDPANVDVDLKPWMTPRFVVVTYDLPRPFVYELLSLDAKEDHGLRLHRIAERDGITMDELTARVRKAAEEYRARQE